MNRSWYLLMLAVPFEVMWVAGFKHADDWITWAGTIAAVLISFYLVITASAKLPVGTVYAVFTGLGTAGTVLAEMFLFNEAVTLTKLLLIALLLAGVLGLKMVSGPSTSKEAS